MSRKLAAAVLALGVLAGAMSLKTVVTAKVKGSVLTANGPDPVPTFRPRPH